jgi:hypothetical protein
MKICNKVAIILIIAVPFLTILKLKETRSVFAASIVNSKHNLSTSGPGPIQSTNETRLCIFCHTPHSSLQSGVAGIDYPLWNHTLSGQSYTVPINTMPAWATLLSSPPTQPDGDSKLCLSCHDGTVALAAIINNTGPPITMTDTFMPPAASGYLGTDLSGHHPVSIAVNQPLIDDKWQQCLNLEVSMQLCNPASGQPVKLTATTNQYSGTDGFSIGGIYKGGVQCSSCHNPHSDPNPNPIDPNRTVFLRVGNRANSMPLCTACHVLCSSSCP